MKRIDIGKLNAQIENLLIYIGMLIMLDPGGKITEKVTIYVGDAMQLKKIQNYFSIANENLQNFQNVYVLERIVHQNVWVIVIVIDKVLYIFLFHNFKILEMLRLK